MYRNMNTSHLFAHLVYYFRSCIINLVSATLVTAVSACVVAVMMLDHTVKYKNVATSNKCRFSGSVIHLLTFLLINS